MAKKKEGENQRLSNNLEPTKRQFKLLSNDNGKRKKIQFSQHKWWRKKTIITTQERVLTSYKIQSNTHCWCCYRPCETVTFVTFMHAFSVSAMISNKNQPKKSKSYQYQTAAAANKTKANRKRIPWFQCRWTSCNNLFNFNIYYNNRKNGRSRSNIPN